MIISCHCTIIVLQQPSLYTHPQMRTATSETGFGLSARCKA